MSAAVRTPTTPGSFSAAAASILTMRACACVLRKNRRMHHAGAVNIADVFADAAQKPHVFFALNS